MRNATSPRRRPLQNFLTARIKPLLLLALVGGLAAGSGAQQPEPGRKPVPQQVKEEKEESAPAEPSRKPIKEEKEEPVKPARGTAERPTSPRAQPRDKAAGLLPEELTRLAQQSSLPPDVRDFFEKLAVPYDIIELRRFTPRRRDFEPIGPYIESAKGQFTIQPLPDKEGKARDPLEVKPNEFKFYEYYEPRAVRQVDQYLKLNLDGQARGTRRYRSRLAMLQDAEKVLVAVANFHKAARAGGRQRQGSDWDGVEQEVRNKLLEVRLKQVEILEKDRHYTDAEDLAERLWTESPDSRTESAFIRLRIRHAQQLLEDGDPVQARKLLDRLDQQIPNRPEAGVLRDSLKQKAESFYRQAQSAAKTGDKGKAIGLLENAQQISPLEGLQKMKAELQGDYPILRVGVRSLPQYFTPGRAVTDAEKQAQTLLFESLMVAGYDPEGGTTYAPQLARGQPRVVPLGRLFELAHNAFWSGGMQLTAADVRRTVEFLQEQQGPGLTAGWAELMDGADSSDPFHVRLLFKQGYVDPLSLATFPVLPGGHQRLDDESFARRPEGSGPFTWPKGSPPDREVVALIANPRYRAGKEPGILEVHFMKTSQPVADFNAGRLDLLLNVPAAAPDLPKDLVKTLPSRRITFLAVNHRRQALQSLELRQALASVIDREKILQERFRGAPAGEGRPLHRALNGPYPPGSWACAQVVRSQLYDLSFAQGLAKKIPAGKLTLLYPDDDERVEQACEDIKKAWTDLGTGVTLEPKRCTPYELFTQVVQTNDYDLAYMSWDYASEAYWLWPLFDPSGRATAAGGTNYLGYKDDAILESYFQKARSHRDFVEVSKWTNEIHRRLHEQMPIIPLWQLDVQVAVQPDVRDGSRRPLSLEGHDALGVFVGIEDWQLVRTPKSSP